MEHQQQHLWRLKAVQLGYVLGLSLIISAIIYFFASNWPGLEKSVKITLSICLFLLFYITSFLVRKWFARQPFLSPLFLFLGCMAFGVSIALLGQIYNSHADSYTLFLIWTIPSLILSLITRYQPMYVLTFLLIHATVWFYLFPSSSFYGVPELQLKLIFLCVATVNGILYVLVEKGLFYSKPLKLLSFLVFHLIMLALTIDELFSVFNIIVSIVYLAILASFYFYYVRVISHKNYTLMVSCAAIAFVAIKFFEFIFYVGSDYIFLFTIILPFILVGFVIYGLKRWKSKGSIKDRTFLQTVISGITIAIASIIATCSIFGITFLITNELPFITYSILAVLLNLLAIINTKCDVIIRYTVLYTGLFIGIPAAIGSTIAFALIFIATLFLGLFFMNSRTVSYSLYFGIIIVVIGLLVKFNYSAEFILWGILCLNGIAFLSRKLVEEPGFRSILLYNSAFYGTGAFFVLTFLYEDQLYLYYLINGLYFVVTTIMVLYLLKRDDKRLFMLYVGFWFAYILYKYYDLVWGLLHKSFTFLITGLLILVLSRVFDRSNFTVNTPKRFNTWLVIGVILFQIIVVGVQVGTSERLLASGELIKVKLAPVDPRSILQGDYLTLRYDISSIDLEEDIGWREPIQVGLTKNDDGVYVYNGTYILGKVVPKASLKHADVWLAGVVKGTQSIEYGIETYFVPEGIGLELEDRVEYALVKVASNGDAILVELVED